MNIIALFSYIFNLYSIIIIIIISFYYHIQNLIMRTYCVCTSVQAQQKTTLKRKKERGVKNDFGNERTRFWRWTLYIGTVLHKILQILHALDYSIELMQRTIYTVHTPGFHHCFTCYNMEVNDIYNYSNLFIFSFIKILQQRCFLPLNNSLLFMSS